MARSTPSTGATWVAGHPIKATAAVARNDYLAHCVELLAPLGLVRTHRMFGGHGIYLDELFIAIVTRDCLYLKADDETRQRFRDAGCHEFIYEMQGTPKSLGYWTVPDDAMEAPPAMAAWARLAIDAALRTRARQAPKKRAATKGRPKAAGKKLGN